MAYKFIFMMNFTIVIKGNVGATPLGPTIYQIWVKNEYSLNYNTNTVVSKYVVTFECS